MSVQFTRPWDTGSLAGPLTTPRAGVMGRVGPVAKRRKRKAVGFMTAVQQPPSKGGGENSGTRPLTSDL